MKTTTARRATAAVAASAAAVIGLPSAASAASTVVPVGPAYGLQCVTQYASSFVRGEGWIVTGSGANFQLRYAGVQIAGSGAQVASFAAETRPGFPNWRGPGYYSFCARNNGSNGSAFISIDTW
ncbi:hypothetical protein GCM10010124_10410 [Pilimelia terevasa]|uniref:Uncharacterized protein n=1 Tax=Pilimelia terevasa TaxID=53372 RepID=A0A8J3FH41_9ACTN|nr:hypothetical protein [Pilimelia terevasa]GGK19725.1 hypothetical protein GCM10010124_10410 [Pilimelia terevasa]